MSEALALFHWSSLPYENEFRRRPESESGSFSISIAVLVSSKFRRCCRVPAGCFQCAALTRRPSLALSLSVPLSLSPSLTLSRADRQQHRRHEKDVEPQVYLEEPL